MLKNLNKENIKISSLSVFMGFLISAIFIAIFTKNLNNFFEFFIIFFQTIFTSLDQIISKFSIYFILAIAIALPLKTKILNIGVSTQMAMGSYFGFITSFYFSSFTSIKGFLLILLSLLVSFIAGLLWSLIPAILKIKLKINEVITTIMFNYIGINLINFFIKWDKSIFYFASGNSSDTKSLTDISIISNINILLIISLLIGIIYYIITNKTTIGLEIDVMGKNKNIAKSAGIKYKRKMLIIFLISGGLAGLAGGMKNLGLDYKYIISSIPPSQGFDAIAIAIVGFQNFLGMLIISFIFSTIEIAVNIMQPIMNINLKIAQLTTVLILLVISSKDFIIKKIFLGELNNE